jgi:hypothetical protein
MKKKILELKSRPAKTFKLGRACQYCGEPIADQERSSKTHCTRYKDEFGVVHDCKRKKHQLKTQLQEDILLDFCARQREIKRQIEKVIAAHGDLVTTEVLVAYNINPADGIGYYYHSGLLYADLLGYKIISNPKLHTHKIEKHA